MRWLSIGIALALTGCPSEEASPDPEPAVAPATPAEEDPAPNPTPPPPGPSPQTPPRPTGSPEPSSPSPDREHLAPPTEEDLEAAVPDEILRSSAYRRLDRSLDTLRRDVEASANPQRIARNAKQVESALAKLERKFPEFDAAPFRRALAALGGQPSEAARPTAATPDEAAAVRELSRQLDALFRLEGAANDPGTALAQLQERLDEVDLPTLATRVTALGRAKSVYWEELDSKRRDLPGLFRTTGGLAQLRLLSAHVQAAAQRGEGLEALRLLEQSEQLFARLAALLPKSSDLSELLSERNTLRRSLEAVAAKQGVGAFHRANVGRLVFSTEALDLSDESASKRVRNRFTRAPSLHATLPLSRPLAELCGDGRVLISARVDGHELKGEFTVATAARQRAHLDLPLIPTSDWIASHATSPRRNLEFLLLLNQRLAQASGSKSSTVVITLTRLGGQEPTGTFELSKSGPTAHKAALLIADVLAAENRLPNVGVKDPALETKLMETVRGHRPLHAHGKPVRLLLLDRSWERVYDAEHKAVEARERTVGVVFKNSDERHWLLLVQIQQVMDTPREVYRPEDLVDSLFTRHPLKVSKVFAETTLLSQTAAQAEVKVRRVIALSPVHVINTLHESVRVQSGNQTQTFKAGQRGNFNFESGQPVTVRTTGGRLLKTITAEDAAKGQIVIP